MISSQSEWQEPIFKEKESKTLKTENISNLSIFNKTNQSKKFSIDELDENTDSNIYKISLEDIISVVEQVKPTNPQQISVGPSGETKDTIENFDGKINIEAMKKDLRNKIDDLLNDDDDDDWQVDIKKD
jgi:hypothetical protein